MTTQSSEYYIDYWVGDEGWGSIQFHFPQQFCGIDIFKRLLSAHNYHNFSNIKIFPMAQFTFNI